MHLFSAGRSCTPVCLTEAGSCAGVPCSTRVMVFSLFVLGLNCSFCGGEALLLEMIQQSGAWHNPCSVGLQKLGQARDAELTEGGTDGGWDCDVQPLVIPCGLEAVELGKFVVPPWWGGLVHVPEVVHQGQPALFQEQQRAYVPALLKGIGHSCVSSCPALRSWVGTRDRVTASSLPWSLSACTRVLQCPGRSPPAGR